LNDLTTFMHSWDWIFRMNKMGAYCSLSIFLFAYGYKHCFLQIQVLHCKRYIINWYSQQMGYSCSVLVSLLEWVSESRLDYLDQIMHNLPSFMA